MVGRHLRRRLVQTCHRLRLVQLLIQESVALLVRRRRRRLVQTCHRLRLVQLLIRRRLREMTALRDLGRIFHRREMVGRHLRRRLV
jgi:hypothetical protein